MADSVRPPNTGGELEIEVELLSPMEAIDDVHLQAVEEDDPWVGQSLEGRYRIQSLLAVGGMGRVYRAVQESLKRPVVVKILDLPPGARKKDPLFQERFALEAETASRLNHPNSVTIFDFGHTDDGVFYIVMEFVAGTPLHRLLRAERRFDPVRAVLLVRQVCRALREAHACHIVHRDLKPSNILIVFKGDEGEAVKVLDFGLAKILAHGDVSGTNLTRVGTFIGTPEYAAPEVTQYGEADFRADIYSVGVLLYRMIRGKVPFRGRTDAATLVMSVHEPVPALPKELGLPRRLESTIYRCLEKDPARRFQTMDELLPALATCLVEMGVESASLVAPSIVSPSLVRLNGERSFPPTASPSLKSEMETTPQVKTRWPYLHYALLALVFVCGIGVAFIALEFRATSPPLVQVESLVPAEAIVPLEAIVRQVEKPVEDVVVPDIKNSNTEDAEPLVAEAGQSEAETLSQGELLPEETKTLEPAPLNIQAKKASVPVVLAASQKKNLVPKSVEKLQSPPKNEGVKVTLPTEIYSAGAPSNKPDETVVPPAKNPTLALPFKALYTSPSSENKD